MKTRDEILAVNDRATAVIDVPDSWGGKLMVQQIPLELAIELAETDSKVTLIDRIIRTIIAGVLNDDGTMKFQPTDAEVLKQRNPAVLIKISKAISDLSGKVTESSVGQAAKN